MCLMVWVGSQRGLPLRALPAPRTPDSVDGYHVVEDVAVDAPVRARFASPEVNYLGSHDGCGCGFNSGTLEFEGFTRVEDVVPLLAAMNEQEHEGFDREQRSRERLRSLVEAAIVDGPVEVYGCWAGDEELAASREVTVDAEYFTAMLVPIEEQVLYRIEQASTARAARPQDPL